MPDYIEGELILIDKPLQWTSFDVVNKVRFLLRKLTGQKKIKVGHAGTLDPLASGLLIVCSGKMTKQIDGIQNEEKEYTGIIDLGAVTASYDLETAVENRRDVSHLSEEEIRKMAASMEGEMDQFPPIYSAKRINGKRAYELARQGLQPEMKSKRISIYQFEIEEINLPELSFRIRCSKGTYIRSIAHDLGQLLGVGGYLKALRRTKIGAHSVEKAQTMEELLSFLEAQITN